MQYDINLISNVSLFRIGKSPEEVEGCFIEDHVYPIGNTTAFLCEDGLNYYTADCVENRKWEFHMELCDQYDEPNGKCSLLSV